MVTPPPITMQPIIDKTASYVARKGTIGNDRDVAQVVGNRNIFFTETKKMFFEQVILCETLYFGRYWLLKQFILEEVKSGMFDEK